MKQAYIKYRGQKMDFQIPPDWNLLTFAEFKENTPQGDVEDITREALKRPVSSLPLTDRVSARDSIAIMVEDLTRASPKKAVLSALLETLDSISIPDQQIVIVIALGTHRALTSHELQEAFGREMVTRYQFINHDCQASDLVPIGKLKTGREVKINARVHAASFKIGIGSIFPHPLNGFGGGSKILFPGVADFDSILEHHLKYSFRSESDLGKVEGNPFTEEVISLARSAKLDFIINSVLDHNDRLFEIVSGDPVKAHSQGIEKCKDIISRKFEKKADLTLITTFPYTEGTQIMKPLAPASMITRQGGCIIMAADCTLPLSREYLAGCEKFREKHGANLREAVLRLFDNNQRILENSAPELNMSMAQALLAQNDFDIILVTEDIPPEQVKQIGFQYAKNLEQAFKIADTYFSKPEVHIVPSGGVILPVI